MKVTYKHTAKLLAMYDLAEHFLKCRSFASLSLLPKTFCGDGALCFMLGQRYGEGSIHLDLKLKGSS